MKTNLLTKTRLIVAILLAMLTVQINGQQVPNVINSWLGNSNAETPTFMPQGIEDMFVTPEGTVYSNVPWEEGGGQVTIINNGTVSHNGGNFGYGHMGGSAICANSKYIYYGAQIYNEGYVFENYWPVEGTVWYGISRRLKSDPNTSDPFQGGVGGGGAMPIGSFLLVHAVSVDANITGVYATETELFVGCYDNKIRVYDANTMAYKREWSVTSPHNIFMDAQGKIWTGIGFNATKIECYDVYGTKQAQVINLPAGSFMGDFCIDKDNRMLIGDVGQREQVLIYTNINTSPSLTSTFGAQNGVYSGTPGKMEPLKFNQIRGIGTDNNGNIYIGNTQWYTGGQGTIIESYNQSTSALNWSKYCVLFVDAMGIDDATDGQDVYGKVEHFKLDYSKPAGQEATLAGYTINKYKYPQDPRLHQEYASVSVRNINGNKIIALSSMNGGISAIYRFNTATDGEVAIPCIYIGYNVDATYPGSIPGIWLWRDANANGQFDANEIKAMSSQNTTDGGLGANIDANGDIWFAGTTNIYQMKCSGVDGNGIPLYDGTVTTIPMPIPFEKVRRVQYDVARDKMYLGGSTKKYPDFEPWRAMGRVIHRYDNWSTGNRTSQSELEVPYEVDYKSETVSFDAEGDYIFTSIDKGYSANLVMGQINIFNASNNASVGYIRAPWEGIGWCDIVQSIDVYKRNNGEYVIIQEEDGHNKNVMYRWCPTGNCTQSTVSVTGVSVSPTTTSVAVNATTPLTETVAPSNASNKSVTWSSSNTTVATVSATGLITGKAAGTSTITVTTADGAKTATCTVTVTSTNVAVTGVTLNTTSASIAVGATTTLTATVAPSNATNKTVSWSSNNTGIATVNSSGVVTGVAAGSATITVTTADQGKTASCVVTVTSNTGSTNIALNKTSLASTSYSADYNAAKGNDGNTNTSWCASSGNLNEWYSVDLGSNANITGSEVMWEDALVYKYKIETSTNNTNWTISIDRTGNTSALQTMTDNFTVSARYVRITVTGLPSGAWASLCEFRVFGSFGAGDTQAPTIPTGLASASITQTSFTLSWSASTDNVGTTGYEVFKNAVSVGTTTTTSLAITGLTCGTSYIMNVKARDAAGNWSTESTNLTVTTLACSGSGKLTGTVIGTTGSWNNSGNTRDKAFDGNTATFFDAASANGAWTGLDLGAANQITSVKFFPRAGLEGRMNGGKFQGSSSADFSSGVVDLYTITTNPPVAWSTATISNTTGFRYVRYLSPNGGYGNVAEVEFYGTAKSAVEVEETNAIALNKAAGVMIYPNPASEVLHISNVALNSEISMFSVDGKLVTKVYADNTDVNLNVSGFEPGLYMLSVNSDMAKIVTRIVVK